MTEIGNPAKALEAAFRRIAAGPMADLPIVNPALAVEAVGFRPWQGRWVGVLITPWFMNLLAWPEAAANGSQKLVLPSGDYECQPVFEQSIGHYLAASLFSPMAQFADQAEAVQVAEAVLEELFTSADKIGESGLSAKLERPLNRRGFLSALLPGEGGP